MNQDIANAIALLQKAQAGAPKAAPKLIHEAITVLLKALIDSHGSGNTEDHTD
jgi:hypothetical protein